MYRLFPFLKVFIFILLCFWPMGCATSPPTKFYLLSPLSQSNIETRSSEDRDPTVVRINAVTIPGYLDRHEIVTRLTENEIHLADLNQWGEPLRDALTNLLAMNLARLLPPKDFVFFPFKCPSSEDYQISVEIIRLDGKFFGEVLLTAQWSILEGDKGDIVVTSKSMLKSSDTPADYGELVAAESRLVEQLSREIALSLQANL